MDQSPIERLYELCCGVQNDLGSMLTCGESMRLVFIENALANIGDAIEVAQSIVNETVPA